MTTYTPPQFATGVPDRNVRVEPGVHRVRPAAAGLYRTAGVTNEAALMADGMTPDWQPGAARGGVPKAAIGALGAALVGGVALAIVLMAPSNKVTQRVQPDPIAQAAATNAAAEKSTTAPESPVNEMERQAPAAGTALATQQAAPAAVRSPVEAVIPSAAPVANAPIARLPKARSAPLASPRVAPPPVPVPVAPSLTPSLTPDLPPVSVSPPADVQPPAMQQTPDAPTLMPSTPAPAPAVTPDIPPAPAPAP